MQIGYPWKCSPLLLRTIFRLLALNHARHSSSFALGKPDDDDAEAVRLALQNAALKFNLVRVKTKDAFQRELRDCRFDAILVNYTLRPASENFRFGKRRFNDEL